MIINSLAVSTRIDLLRRQNGLSQEQLAAELQVSQPAVSKYLCGRVPPAGTLLRLAAIGSTTVEWILTGQKSYAFGGPPAKVQEPGTVYDADWQTAQKIAALPAPLKEALLRIIGQLIENDRQGAAKAAKVYAAE